MSAQARARIVLDAGVGMEAMMSGARSVWRGPVVTLLASLMLLAGCATPPRLPAVPEGLTLEATPAAGRVRYWSGDDPAALLAEARASQQRLLAYRASVGDTSPLKTDFLAISGGADDGAFGAGLLNGWSQAGDRPQFRLVTGVSAGALIAPFAFLGSRYDDALRQQFTGVTQKDIYIKRNLIAGIFSDALADSAPLARQIARYVTPELLQAIAAEYVKGRMLLVGTTDLDSRRGVIWNMGAIASSHDPHALELFRKVTLASASIPGIFPPVMIDVTVDGVHYQEMHVDGGITNQVFLYPEDFQLGQATAQEAPIERKVYVIRNGRLDPDWSSVDRRTLKILGLSISALITNQSLGDVSRIYLTSLRDRIDYNLAYIPADFDVHKSEDFQPAYMRPLFDRGFEMARHGYPWAKAPPNFGTSADRVEDRSPPP